MTFFLWDSGRQPWDHSAPGLALPALMFIAGVFFLVLGTASYVIVLYTNGFTFDFSRPVWDQAKVRMYLANIFVPLLFMVGVGLILSVVLTPVLLTLGMSGSLARMLPVLACIGVMQIVLVWVLVWAPLEKRLIRKRLAAKGITEAQLSTGLLIGLSDPAKSSLKKLTCIEEDIGMLWFDAEQLIYWGDTDQFSARRGDLMDVERSLDAASTSALSGTAHVILRVRRPDGGERRIRLHTEGIWTLGGKRRAMNDLAERIATWKSRTAPPPVPAH
jgi:hypothetical protein